MISDNKFTISLELVELAYSYLRDGYEQALNALEEAETENANLRDALKHRDWISRMLGEQTARVANLEQLVRDLYEMAYPECPSAFEAAFADRIRKLGVEVKP